MLVRWTIAFLYVSKCHLRQDSDIEEDLQVMRQFMKVNGRAALHIRPTHVRASLRMHGPGDLLNLVAHAPSCHLLLIHILHLLILLSGLVSIRELMAPVWCSGYTERGRAGAAVAL